MRIGIGSAEYFDLDGVYEGMARLKSQGYDCVDYQLLAETHRELYLEPEAAFEQRMKDIAAAAADNGVEICQTHGPWRWPPRDVTKEDRAERFEKMAKSLRATRLLGCPYCIIHPIMPFGIEEQPDIDLFYQLNFDHFSGLTRIAEQEGVVICLENMPMPKFPLATPAAILDFVKKINSPAMRVCLDTGHSIICGVSPADAVRELGTEYLKTLHVHDNNGERDLHWTPYTGVIDWPAFSAALNEVGYEGVLSLEVTLRKNSMPKDILEYHEIGLMQIARRLTQMP